MEDSGSSVRILLNLDLRHYGYNPPASTTRRHDDGVRQRRPLVPIKESFLRKGAFLRRVDHNQELKANL